MIIFDTYAWIEYFNGTLKGEIVAKHVKSNGEIAVSALCLAELKVKYEREGIEAEALLKFVRLRSVVVPVDEVVALLTAVYRLKHGLYIVDAVMYATALHLNSRLLTGDKHFSKLERIEFLG